MKIVSCFKNKRIFTGIKLIFDLEEKTAFIMKFYH